jgi:hypothetical protein
MNRFIAAFAFLGTICIQVYAGSPKIVQDDGPSDKIWLETGFGINFFGPAKQMAKLMIESDFDETSTSWLFGGTTEHPHYSVVGPSVQISFHYHLGQISRLGLRVYYSGISEVMGYHVTGTYLFVKFTNFSIAPLYTLKLGKSFEVETGPALMINIGNRSDANFNQPESNFTKLSPALLTDISLLIWNATYVYGKLSSQLLLTYKNTMGPYTAVAWDGSNLEIPESRIGFSHMNCMFVLGVHF